jgi:hypothetical protein
LKFIEALGVALRKIIGIYMGDVFTKDKETK